MRQGSEDVLLGHINLLIHEVQKTEGIHLSDQSRYHIERLLTQAVMKYSEQLRKEKEYWRNKYFEVEYKK